MELMWSKEMLFACFFFQKIRQLTSKKNNTDCMGWKFRALSVVFWLGFQGC